jgi:dipeptidyl aminopeptidase/acylaminoacyl peptidase
MKITLAQARLGFCGLGGVLLSACTQEFPPAPISTPSYERLTATLEYERPAWSPDGSDLFFSGGPPEHFRLYRTGKRGGPLVDVLNQPHCGNVAVNRTRRRIAYNVYRPNVALEIWTANLDGSSPQRVTKSGHCAVPEWSPDGSRIAYLSFPDCTVRIIPALGGEAKTIGKSLSRAVWSPTGAQLAFVEGEQAAGRYQATLLTLADGTRRTLRSTVATNMPENLFRRMGLHFDWSPDGRQLAWPVLVDGRLQLGLVDVGADRLVRMLPTANSASEPRFSPDGRWIAYVSESSGSPRGIRVLAVQGTEDGPVTQPAEFVKGEFIRYPTASGLQIPAFLFRPAATAKARRPALVWLHGSVPNGATLDWFDPAIQYFAGNGFFVLAPNYRPSAGFGGQVATATSSKDIAADVAAAAAYLKGLGDIDPNRVCVLGTSFGGYAVLRTITTCPSAFAAAVDICGPCDLKALYQDVPEQRPVMTAMLGGSPKQRPEHYREESPVTQVDRISIPVLAIHGTADETIPYRQSQILAGALAQAGKRHQLITYKGVGHGFPNRAWANAMQQAMSFLLQELKCESNSSLR